MNIRNIPYFTSWQWLPVVFTASSSENGMTAFGVGHDATYQEQTTAHIRFLADMCSRCGIKL